VDRDRRSLRGYLQRRAPRQPVDHTVTFAVDPAEWPSVSDWCRDFERWLSELGEVKAAEIAEQIGAHFLAERDKLIECGYASVDAWIRILAQAQHPLRAAQLHCQKAALGFRRLSDRNDPIVSVNSIGLDIVEMLIPSREPGIRDHDSEASLPRRPYAGFEARLLTREDERREFARNLAKVRMMRGVALSETRRSVISEVHLAFGEQYALYDSAEPNKMLAGMSLHDLSMYSQSYPEPDLTDFPPEAVVECSNLWAKATDAGRIIRQAVGIFAGQRKTQAVLLYPIVKPWNLSGGYRHDFDCAGEPIEWPYARTLDGDKIYVQAMVVRARNLLKWWSAASSWEFNADQATSLIFNSPFSVPVA